MPTWYPRSGKCQARGKYEFCIVRFRISNPPPAYLLMNRRAHTRLLCLCVSGSLCPRALCPGRPQPQAPACRHLQPSNRAPENRARNQASCSRSPPSRPYRGLAAAGATRSPAGAGYE